MINFEKLEKELTEKRWARETRDFVIVYGFFGLIIGFLVLAKWLG